MQANSKHMSSKSTRLDLTKKFIQGLSANNSKKANMIHVSCMYIYNNLDVIIILYFLFCWLFPYQTSNMQTWILKPCQAQPSSPLDPHRFWVDRNAPSASDQGALKIENLHLVNLYSSNQVTWKLLLAVYKVYIYIHRIIEDIFLSRFSCLSHFDKHDSNHLPLQMELHMLIIPRSQWKT